MKQRTTRQLRTTYAVLTAQRDHPTAEQVFARVRRVLPRVSLGTVYRNLEKLRAAGRVRLVRLADGVARYDAVVEEHDHFVCEGCGKVIDLALPVPRRGLRDLEQAGYTVYSLTTAVYGLCRGCAMRKRGAGTSAARRVDDGEAKEGGTAWRSPNRASSSPRGSKGSPRTRSTSIGRCTRAM